MFLRHFGPGDDNFGWAKADKERNDEDQAEAEAALAHQDILQRVLSHYNGWVVDFRPMDTNEKAFASLFEELFMVVEDSYLFRFDLDYWRDKLGLDLPPFVQLIKAIDEHTGGSDWRQICYLEERQYALIKTMCQEYEADRARALQYRATHQEEGNAQEA